MIDHERLSEMEADFGTEELAGIIDTFLGEAAGAIGTLAATGSDPAVRRERLHFLKGCARTIGAVRLGDLCERLEVAEAFGPDDAAGLAREFRAVRDALDGRELRKTG